MFNSVCVLTVVATREQTVCHCQPRAAFQFNTHTHTQIAFECMQHESITFQWQLLQALMIYNQTLIKQRSFLNPN